MNSRHSGIRYQLIFTIILIIYASALAYLAYPIAKGNLEELNVIKHYDRYIEEKHSKEFETFMVFLHTNNGLVSIERSIEVNARDLLHLALEALLLGPSEEDLKKGIITYIPKDTELVGVSESNGSIFVEFSKEILDSRNPDAAYSQIESTIRHSMTCKDIYIIANNSIINR